MPTQNYNLPIVSTATDYNNQFNYRYNYAVSNPWSIRLANLFGILALLATTFGYAQFLGLNWFYLLFFGPIILINISSNFFTKAINLFFPKFDRNEHEAFIKDFWINNKPPSVDIFLPIAGESIDIIKKTWQAVNKLEYNNFNVYVLDDKADQDAKELASECGFNYLCRPNRGEFKKAGNLQYGYAHSSGEYVLVLDADFAPVPTALTESLPYIMSDKEMSILQTPQYFDTDMEIHKRSPIEYGAGVVVEEFYRITQPSKSIFGLAMCVGTSAIYRREAIVEVGIPLVSHTEDLRQGLMTMSAGYHLGYIPLIISKGICPDNLQAYYSQQLRWAYGSVETLFSSFLYDAKLNLWGKVNFLSSTLYYLAEATAPLLSLQLLCLLFFNTDSLKLGWVLPFVPYIVYELLVRPRMLLSKKLYGVKLAGITQMFTYLDAMIRYFLRQPIAWKSTNVKDSQNEQQISNNYFTNTTASTIFSAIYIFLFGLILFLRPNIIFNVETYTVLFIAFYRAYIYSDYALTLFNFVHKGIIRDLENKIINAFHFHFWRIVVVGSMTLSVILLFAQIFWNLSTHFPDGIEWVKNLLLLSSK